MNKRFEHYFKIADILIHITGPKEWEPEHFGALASFLTSQGNWMYEVNMEVTETLSEPNGKCVFEKPGLRVFCEGEVQELYIGPVNEQTGNAYLKATQTGNVSLVELKRMYLNKNILSKTILNSMQAEHILTEQYGFLLHAAAIDYMGRAILFTAPSGTGKSTQADLWNKTKGTPIINGDRIGVRIIDNEIKVYGIPFSGSSGICKNAELPLGAVIYLSQGKDNQITQLSGGTAFSRIWEGCSINQWSRKDIERSSNTILQVVKRVPVYHLSCRKDKSAVEVLAQTLKWEENT